MTEFIRPTEGFFNTENNTVVHSTQEITDEFMDEIRFQQEQHRMRYNGLTPVASVPESIWNSWIRENRDPDSQDARTIQKWLREADMKHFLITEKSF